MSINHGTLYPVLLKLEQGGAIAAEWGVSENNRRAKFYRITKAGQKQLEEEVSQWAQATGIVARFLALKEAKHDSRTAARVASILGSVLRRRGDGDLAEELDSHIQLMTDEEIRRGTPRDEALFARSVRCSDQ